MKKRSAVILVCLALALGACSNGGGEKKTSSVPAPAVETKKVVKKSPPAAAPQTSAAGNGQCRALVEDLCMDCHNEGRICSKIGKKSRTRWHRTIKRMISHGAQVDQQQGDALTECFLNETDDLRALCGVW